MFTTIDRVKNGDAIHLINDGYTILVHEVFFEREWKWRDDTFYIYRVKGVMRTPFMKKDGTIGVNEQEFNSTIDKTITLVKVDNK